MTGRVVPLKSDAAGDPRMGGTPDERVAAVGASGRPKDLEDIRSLGD